MPQRITLLLILATLAVVAFNAYQSREVRDRMDEHMSSPPIRLSGQRVTSGSVTTERRVIDGTLESLDAWAERHLEAVRLFHLTGEDR